MGPIAAPTPPVIPPDPPVMWSAGMPPESMAAFLVTFLRNHFTDANNIEDAAFRSRLWVPGPASPIVIESCDRFDRKLVEARLGVFVKDHAWRPRRQGINDEFMGGASRDGSRSYAVIFDSACTVFAIGGEPREAKQLATEITRELLKYGPLIREQLGLVRFVVVERGECATLEESTQNYAVPITVAFQSGEQWKIKPVESRLMKVILQVTTELYGERN